MHAKVFSATTVGVDAHPVDVEADISMGLVNFHIVGLPDTAIKESSKRISTALKNSGIRFPAKLITINLAPADLRKEGTLFDLPIAVAILQAQKHIAMPTQFIQETIFLGELSLDGSIRGIKGALAVACDAPKLGKKRLIVPKTNAQEAALIEELEVIGVSSLTELIAYLRKEIAIKPTPNQFKQLQQKQTVGIDYAQVKGQQQAKRALQIAAAGKHNLLFIGPPGAGKTMLAKRLPTIMSPMQFEEVLQTSKVYSIMGKLNKEQPLITIRPFRNPHHTTSQAGLVGGGSYPQPGEISLAQNGILFLDELTEFKRSTLEVLRQPLENKNVCISRAQQSVTFPASFVLVAALNPCPCGYLGDKKRQCTCSQIQINRYLEKLSGPLLDRIDLQISVQSVEYDTIKNKELPAHSSRDLYKPIKNALNAQYKRFKTLNHCNAHITADEIEQHCTVTPQAETMVKQAFEKLNLSMRGYHKLLKVARTIADLASSEVINVEHVQEAIMYRSLDQHLERMRA